MPRTTPNERNAAYCLEDRSKSSRADRLAPRERERLIGHRAGRQDLSLDPESRVRRRRGEEHALVRFRDGPQPDGLGVLVAPEDGVRLQRPQISRLLHDWAL